MLESIYIIAADDASDGASRITDDSVRQSIDSILEHSKSLGLKIKQLHIDPLSAGWDHPPALPGHFRSGNGPLMAVELACNELRVASCDVIVITGCDKLKSEYTANQRHLQMAIYPKLSLPELYTNLAKSWCQLHGLNDEQFKVLASKLFDNYTKTYVANTGKPLSLETRWFEPITSLFRGVDCANPVVDFSGSIVLATANIAKKIQVNGHDMVQVSGIGNCLSQTSYTIESAMDLFMEQLADYKHLKSAYTMSCSQARVNFEQLFKEQQAYLEVYTCFPVVPLAFLYASGLAHNYTTACDIADNYPLTITGGMNLAKAAWNMPVLRAIIAMYHKLLKTNDIQYAGIHGNGGLGEKQGFLILKK